MFRQSTDKFIPRHYIQIYILHIILSFLCKMLRSNLHPIVDFFWGFNGFKWAVTDFVGRFRSLICPSFNRGIVK